ncbi:MAG: Glu/Leu/Phe/Val family dehydrogenase, partial [Candidatus Nanopelagicaceae bacterium]
GSLGRTTATGDGVAISVREALIDREMSIEGARIAIQGFGKVGYWTAIAAESMGMKVVAVSDVSGGVKDFGSIADLYRHIVDGGEISTYAKGERISNEELLHLDVDVLVPAALSDAITAKSAPGIRAKIVVEGANAPTTPEGDRIMHENGITVIPDILANSGGVIVSYFEWVQDKQNYFWSADQIKENLESMMMKAFGEVRHTVKESKVSWRDAAMMIGVGRVAEAHKLRGLYP